MAWSIGNHGKATYNADENDHVSPLEELLSKLQPLRREVE